MANKATIKELDALMGLLVRHLTNTLEENEKDNIPTDAATLSVITKLLKDNNVTADPASSDDLSALREKLTVAANQRRAKASNVVALAEADVARMIV